MNKKQKIWRIIGWELFFAIFAGGTIFLKVKIERILLPPLWFLITLWVLVAVIIIGGMWFEMI
ncbi:unnamed protein product [marine sediment metagenome]|uniref:DUF5668 domain-containing protein n=1 Tax=marine sediment metagenome TaxID=412755 RepID=X0X5C5_9ZZZZ